MWIRNRLIAGLCVGILAVPFYIAGYINDTVNKEHICYIQLEDNVVVAEENRVYITPTGECYHLKKTCAGKNAIETTLEKEEKEKRPCKKCVY